MADIFKITQVLTKILEVLCFIGTVGMIIGGVFYLFYDKPEDIIKGVKVINTCGMTVSTAGLTAEKAAKVVGAAFLVSSVLYALLGMIFRNVNLTVRTSEGKTWFAQGATPFQDDTIRMVKEIGIFLIFIYVIELVGTMIVTLICEDAETSTTMLPLFIGIIVLCLSKIFEYGKQLQDTEDGLI